MLLPNFRLSGGLGTPLDREQGIFALRQICPPRIWLPAGTHWGRIGQILKRLPFVLDVWVRKGETHLQTSLHYVQSWTSACFPQPPRVGNGAVSSSPCSLSDWPCFEFGPILNPFLRTSLRKIPSCPQNWGREIGPGRDIKNRSQSDPSPGSKS